MKKYKLILLLFISIFNISCIDDDFDKENLRPITEELPIAGKFKKNVLIEDYTGTWCVFCPRVSYGISLVLSENLDAYPVAIHRSSTTAADPFNFDALSLENFVGVSGYPAARLNRKINWVNQVNTSEIKQKMSPNSDLGLALTSTISSGNINLDVNMKFANNLSNLKLVVYVLEDDLVYPQANSTQYYGGLSLIPNFVHNHVLRSCLTDLVNGEAINGATNGATITRNFNFPIPSNISNSNKIGFVAFVIDADGNAINVRGSHINESQSFQENL